MREKTQHARVTRKSLASECQVASDLYCISVVGVHHDNTLINAQAAWYMEFSIGAVLNAIE